MSLLPSFVVLWLKPGEPFYTQLDGEGETELQIMRTAMSDVFKQENVIC